MQECIGTFKMLHAMMKDSYDLVMVRIQKVSWLSIHVYNCCIAGAQIVVYIKLANNYFMLQKSSNSVRVWRTPCNEACRL